MGRGIWTYVPPVGCISFPWSGLGLRPIQKVHRFGAIRYAAVIPQIAYSLARYSCSRAAMVVCGSKNEAAARPPPASAADGQTPDTVRAESPGLRPSEPVAAASPSSVR